MSSTAKNIKNQNTLENALGWKQSPQKFSFKDQINFYQFVADHCKTAVVRQYKLVRETGEYLACFIFDKHNGTFLFGSPKSPFNSQYQDIYQDKEYSPQDVIKLLQSDNSKGWFLTHKTAASIQNHINKTHTVNPNAEVFPGFEFKDYDKTKTTKVKNPKPMMDVAIGILMTENRFMSCREIMNYALQKNIYKTNGKTPSSTLSASIGVEIKKMKQNARFVRGDNFKIGLNRNLYPNFMKQQTKSMQQSKPGLLETILSWARKNKVK